MSKSILNILLPPNSKRRLLYSLICRACTQPRDFFRYVNLASFRYFLNYLRAADPELVERMVQEVLDRDKGQADQSVNINEHFLDCVLDRIRALSAIRRQHSVDVIIPVYNAPALTEACIASILRNSDRCRLIIVNDGSTDPAIVPLLDSVRGLPERSIDVVVRHNDTNLGFVRTVNFARTLARGHFVVLNSDTEVPPGWLDRLFAPIFAEPDRIASVTPFTNAGMQCSFPEPDGDFPIFNGLGVDELDDYFRRYGATKPVEISTGVGFCMAFNQNVVDRIGLFDEETFGRGYGEECDWSLRAYDAGYTNMLVPNLFVYHKHGGSFDAGEKDSLISHNSTKLWDKHYRHLTRHREIVTADAPRFIRDSLVVIVDAKNKGARKKVALLDVDLDGGGTIYSESLAREFVFRGFEVVHLKYNFRQQYLKIRIDGQTITKTIVLPDEGAHHLPRLFEFLAVDFVAINELFSWPDPLSVMHEMAGSRTPYLVLIHDFFMLCPNWFLIDDSSTFCGLPDDPVRCARCLGSKSQSLRRDIYGDKLTDLSEWRAQVSEYLAGARQLFCFSESAAGLVDRTFPHLPNLMVVPHCIPNRERFVWKRRGFSGRGPLHVGILGNLFLTKGENIVKELIATSRFKNLEVKLTVFGVSPLYPAGYRSEDGRIAFSGQYRQEDLPALLEEHGVHVVLISSILPETFSYTTSEAILLGYPVICFDLGAQAERVKNHRCGIIVPEISAAGLLGAFEELLQRPSLVEELSCNGRTYAPASPEEHFGQIAKIIEEAVNGCGVNRVHDAL